MKLSADPSSPDYHDIARFASRVTVDGEVVPNILSVDTDAGEAVCVSTPIVVKHGQIETHTVKGKIVINLPWPLPHKEGEPISHHYIALARLYGDWRKREEMRREHSTS